MRPYASTILLILISLTTFGQIDSTDKNVRHAIKGAGQYLQSIMGSNLYKKHIRVDYENSRESGLMVYSKSYDRPQYLRTEKCYELNFFLIKDADTLAYLNLLVDTTGHLAKYDYDASSFSSPELIIGYKRLLTGNFKIDYKKAVAIGRQKGFKGNPFLQAETENKSITTNNQTYVKVKYLWSFFEFTGNTGSAFLDINAETGEIEKEKYIPPMPK